MTDRHDHTADGSDALPAGEFAAWLSSTEAAIRGEIDADVPCGSCVGCCSAAQFVHIAADEVDALAHIPKQLLFAAPGAPRGHVLMGYDEHGRCPMLRADGCSIYAHRPRTCRTYDCRVFAAADLDPGEDVTKALVAVRARRWRFDHRDEEAIVHHAAVRAAAAWMAEHGDELPDGLAPRTVTQTAVVAVLASRAFTSAGDQSSVVLDDPPVESVMVELTRRVPRTSRTSSR